MRPLCVTKIESLVQDTYVRHASVGRGVRMGWGRSHVGSKMNLMRIVVEKQKPDAGELKVSCEARETI